MSFYKRSAFGTRYKGQDYSKVVDLTQPDQALSIEEILERFTRNEPLPVDMGGEFGGEDMDNPLNVDLEKMARADLADKADYYNALEELKKRYQAQETESARKKREDEDKAAKLALEAEIRAKIASESSSA